MSRMLNIREAAETLGYTVKGLRRIVDQSRAKSRGETVQGPVIKFFQTTRRAPVLFRHEWLEEFIDSHTVDPSEATKNGSRAKKKHVTVSIETTSGLDAELFEVQ